MTEIRTLRPGLLVSMSTQIKGGVQYDKFDLETPHIDTDGVQRARWETRRIITDPAEHDAASKLRGKARNLVTGVCAWSAFGLLCPESRFDDLTAAITDAQKLVNDFNATASVTRISFNVIYGRIAQDDVAAVRAISGEIRELMTDMQTGLAALDVQKVRDACAKAREVGQMLSDDAKGRLDTAIKAARQSASAIVKAGENVVQEIDRATIEKIGTARTSFLDLEDVGEVAAPAQFGRAIDIEAV